MASTSATTSTATTATTTTPARVPATSDPAWPAVPSPSPTQEHEDHWIDLALDWLRKHRLPPWLERIVSLVMAATCLIYYGISYLSSCTFEPLCFSPSSRQKCCSSRCRPRLPLMTDIRRRQQDRLCPYHLYRLLCQALEDRAQLTLTKHTQCSTNETVKINKNSNDRLVWIRAIRSDAMLRRLVSQFMMATDQQQQEDHSAMGQFHWRDHHNNIDDDNNNNPNHPPYNPQSIQTSPLYQRLDEIWLELLALPYIDDTSVVPALSNQQRQPQQPQPQPHSQQDLQEGHENNNNQSDNSNNHSYCTTATDHHFNKSFVYDVSLIVPIYQESTQQVARTLHHAYNHCIDHAAVQIVIVLAAQGHDHENALDHFERMMNIQMQQQQQQQQQQQGGGTLPNSKYVGPKTGSPLAGAEHSNGFTSMDAAAGITTTTTTTSTNNAKHGWGDWVVVHFMPTCNSTKQGDDNTNNNNTVPFGRGPTLNYGAEFATGCILTFLHCDTLLPAGWDRSIVGAFALSPNRSLSSCMATTTTTTTTTPSSPDILHACSLIFGHDTSPQGLNGMPYPVGIDSIWFLGNLRAWLFRLPYGDHVISMPSSYFHYVGGYPEQCIMEDYSMMDFWRQRVQNAHRAPNETYPTNRTTIAMERMRILPIIARCSVRRWQRWGVSYVTAVNAILVHRYAHQDWTAENVYYYYYIRPESHQQQQKQKQKQHDGVRMGTICAKNKCK